MTKKGEALAKNSLPQLEELEGMGFCRTYRYGNKVIKFMLPGGAESFAMILKKWKSLDFVPKIYGKVEDILVMKFFEGKPKFGLGENQLAEIGKVLRKLHKDSEGFGKLKGKTFEFPSFLKWIEDKKREIQEDISPRDVPLMDKWFYLIKGFKPKPVLVHGDFGLHHIIWQGNKLVGIIDFENAQSAPAELDIANLRYTMDSYGSLNKEDFERIIRGYSHKVDWKLVYLLEAYLCIKNLRFLNKINPEVEKKSRKIAISLLKK